MAFVHQHRATATATAATAEVAVNTQHARPQPLEQSEEWVLFSPAAPSTIARTQTTSTDRTRRTAGLSRFSEFGSLDTAARSERDDAQTSDDVGDDVGTEEELDSLDDGLHAFHEPSEYRLETGDAGNDTGDTVLPTHDGLGEFQPHDNALQEHMLQFERLRRRPARRRSSVQRHFSVLDEPDHATAEQGRRQRIERWRLEQSRALLEEIEKETRRRRRMSTASTTQGRAETTQQGTTIPPKSTPSIISSRSGSSEGATQDLSFWQRITRTVIRDLIGLDEDTLSVIFGETLPEETILSAARPLTAFSAEKAIQDAGIDASTLSEDWQTKLLERVAQELGTLVHQLSEHPGAFSTYQSSISNLDYAGLKTSDLAPAAPSPNLASAVRPATDSSPASAQFAPTFPQPSYTYSEASLWGIEEEPEPMYPHDASRTASPPITSTTVAEDLVREREYWERELDVKMIFNFLVKRFTSQQSGISQPQTQPQLRHPSTVTPVTPHNTRNDTTSARRAAIIRQNHPLVSRTPVSLLPTSSASLPRETKTYRAYFTPQNTLRHHLRHHHPKLRSNSSCASQSTKKSKRSNSSSRNYWDLGGSVGSVAGEV